LHQVKVPSVDRTMPFGAYDPKELMEAEGHEEPACPYKISSDHSVTSIAWKQPGASQFKAVTSDGQIFQWDSTNPNGLKNLYTSEHNYYHAIDYSHDDGQISFVLATCRSWRYSMMKL
jgi:hypothetical protein